MHGCLGDKKWIQRRHMWPVPSRATFVADSDSSSPDSFLKDGRKICVGDCALFKPPQESPPFIGIIRWLTVDKQDSVKLGVNWLYRPADVELGKGNLLEAAPNEVFYSFHKDEIPAASLLHPCKVSFLRKGVELPSGISSFVCRRVYDTENKCLWWLTDKDYIKGRQEEVDKLLDKTRLEMHGTMQSGGRSPKPLNGPASMQQLKSGSDSIQNSTSSFASQAKGKKRERGDQGSDPIKRERLSRTEDDTLKSEITKITDKGGVVDLEGVEKLVQLMQPGSGDKKLELAGRKLLVDVIAVTDRFDCLEHFVHLKGLPVLDEWLQEIQKGRIGDGSNPKESDKSVEEFLLALLRALDKVPVNLHALQTCNIGKSVNHLRSNKNSEIQKKARSLVDTWKKRVEAEMNMNDSKSGPSRSVSWPTKQVPSEVSNVGSRKAVGYSENAPKVFVLQPSASKTSQGKPGSGDSATKSSFSPCSTKSLPVSAGPNLKESNFRTSAAGGSSDVPLTPLKVERSSSSSQSLNNSQSCSSDHAKTVGSSCRSTAGSVSVNKISSGSRHRKSSNGILGPSVVQKETVSGKVSAPNKNLSSEKASSTGVTYENSPDVPHADHGNSQRLILRLPNTGRSPGRGGGGGSFEDPGGTGGRDTSGKQDNHERKPKGKSDMFRVCSLSNMNNVACHSKDGLTVSDGGNGLPHCNERRSAGEEGDKHMEVSKATSSSLGIVPRAAKSCDASLSSINALIESCAKFSESSASPSPGDDRGMNLLASVATGEYKSENVSPSSSPGRSSPAPEESCSGNNSRLRQSGEEVAQTRQPSDGANGGSTNGLGATVASSQAKDEVKSTAIPISPTVSVDRNGTSFYPDEKSGECSVQLNSSLTNLQQNADDSCLRSDVQPGNLTHDASIALSSPVLAKKEDSTEAEASLSKLKGRTQLLNDDDKVYHADARTLDSNSDVALEASTSIVKVEIEMNDKSPCSSSEKVGEYHKKVDKESSSGILPEQKQPLVAESNMQSFEGKVKDADTHSGSYNASYVESKADKAVDLKAVGYGLQSERLAMDLGSFNSLNSDQKKECTENSEKNNSVRHVSGASVSHVESSLSPVQDKEPCEKPSGQKLNVLESEVTDERNIAREMVPVSAAGPDVGVKLDFDLNEGFSFDDGGQGELVKLSGAVPSASVHLPCPMPFPMSSLSGSFPASITVAAAAKGPFPPPENPLRTKGERGWKGSAATSAFRPASPRKNMEIPVNTSDVHVFDAPSNKQGRPALDFDLNVPDERVLEDVATRISAQATCSDSGSLDRGAGGLDLDLNRVDDSPDVGPFAVSRSCGLEIPCFPTRPSLAGGLSNGGVNISRGFDLNSGPGLDDVGTEAVPRSQHTKSSLPFQVSTPGIRINSAEFGNYSWFPPGNAYSAIAVPPILPGRGEQSYVATSGSQRILGPTGSTAFVPELYRGPVLSSTPAVAFPSPTPFQYPGGFPFETSFPLSSNSFSGSTAYMDSTTGGAVCYPTIPSQLVGPAGVVSSPCSRPFVMNLHGGTSSVASDSRKWGNQGLDLNAGPGVDSERRDDRVPSALRQVSLPVPQALAEEQLKMFQMAGNVVKRKEPDGGWDSADRFSYKQPSWQ